MLLRDLLKNISAKKIIGNADVEIGDIVRDSRNAKAGSLFVCIPGEKLDGTSFAKDAASHGAVAILAEKPVENVDATVIVVDDVRLAMNKIVSEFYGYPQDKLKLVGITGTNGKTTSTCLIRSILAHFGKKSGLIGTNQYIIDKKSVKSTNTTPYATELIPLFKEMVDVGCEYCIMEISSIALALNKLSECKFEATAFTNLTQDHLDFHGTMENYLKAKEKLFTMCKIGAVNVDDPASSEIIKNATCDILTFGIDNKSSVRASNIQLKNTCVEFDVTYGGETVHVKLNIPGRFSVYNGLTAILTCINLGFNFKEIVAALGEAAGVKGRIESVETNRDFSVIIDYAHSPDGLVNILNAVRGFAKGRVVTLFGCGGDRDKTKRPKMGKIAGELSDFCIVTSDNPRTEDPSKIIADILPGISETSCEYVVIEDRHEAIKYAILNAKKDDVVVLVGKGHETYQILKDKTIDFDEHKIVRDILTSTDKNDN
jgi:UDP-N-acetylmuramoyl-L-alanyl-D-glutamate--2,6-diaminopimelate ligase